MTPKEPQESRPAIVDTWIREEQFNGRIDKDAIHEYARAQKASGELIFKLHQGGIRSAVLVKKIDADLDLSEVDDAERKRLGV